jgi:hypothetical protein
MKRVYTDKQKLLKSLKAKAVRKFWNEIEIVSWEHHSPAYIIESLGITRENEIYEELVVYINTYHNKKEICSTDIQFTNIDVLEWYNNKE